MKRVINYRNVFMLFVFCCCAGPAIGEVTITVPLFEDGFETHDCGDPIDFFFPYPVGYSWQHIGADYDYHTVDCTFAHTGNASLRTERVTGGYSQGLTIPYGYAMKGMTTVFEHDVYITSNAQVSDPNWGGGGFSADVGQTTSPMRWYVSNFPGSTWRYTTGSDLNYIYRSRLKNTVFFN